MRVGEAAKNEIKNLLVRKHRLSLIINSTDEQTYGGKFDSLPKLRIELADISTKLKLHEDDVMETLKFQRSIRTAAQKEEYEMEAILVAINEENVQEACDDLLKYNKDKAVAEMVKNVIDNSGEQIVAAIIQIYEGLQNKDLTK